MNCGTLRISLSDIDDVLWEPSTETVRDSTIGRFASWVATTHEIKIASYEELRRWSLANLDAFWQDIATFFELRTSVPAERALVNTSIGDARWLPGARLNYAEHALRHEPDGSVAVIGESQTRPPSEITWRDLHDAVARAREGLRRLGVGRGDRVAAYLPNVPETIAAFLATASLGAIWSSCAPEFGVRAVLDRFGQIEPVVLLSVDGYRYGNRAIDLTANVDAVRAALPSLRATVSVPYLGGGAPRPGTIAWTDLLAEHADLEFEQVPAEHPLYILYSSGTTGLPKPIVHGHGGILLEHLKTIGLHADLGGGDRFFWFTTTGWMMWNYLVSGLLVGATIVTFDGDPGWPSLDTLWALAERTGTTWFGASAPFLLACKKEGLRPGAQHDLSRLRAVGSTGAPLPADGFRWVYETVGRDLMLSSISGGTDVCSAFVGGCPMVPVRAGVISCRYLGAAVAAFDEDGRSVVGRQGELVITAPMPSMPVGFWGDDDGSRYRRAYFETFPGVWSHGDWIEIDDDGGCVISGRSDATLNRAGVRMGTSEIYRVVEGLPQVADALIVHLEAPDGGPGELILFVVTRSGLTLDEDLRREISASLRAGLSPRHVPDSIHDVRAVPTTLSGKKLELPVKRILLGADADEVASRDALRDPSALDEYVQFAAARRSEGALDVDRGPG